MAGEYLVSKKYHEISVLAGETAKQVAKNGKEWTKYLDTGSADCLTSSRCAVASFRCRTDFADIQNKKECGGNRQWQRRFLRNWAADTKGKVII